MRYLILPLVIFLFGFQTLIACEFNSDCPYDRETNKEHSFHGYTCTSNQDIDKVILYFVYFDDVENIAYYTADIYMKDQLANIIDDVVVKKDRDTFIAEHELLKVRIEKQSVGINKPNAKVTLEGLDLGHYNCH